ncbi:MAG: hypothetical protein AAGH67_19245 [Cyanobacteria bacterium P01_H01_bin.162]
MKQIDRLPDSLVQQVDDFVNFLIWQQQTQSQKPKPANDQPDQEDVAWLNSDLSNLDQHEPYEWAEGELEQGKTLKYIAGQGLVIEE